MQKKHTAYKGRTINYSTTGSGMPVVLLHGFGEDSRIWKNQVTALKEHTLIIPDLPGSGSSPMAEDMSMEGLADAMHQVVQAESLSSFVLIGHSMGGYVALAYAEKYPGKLTGLGLFHSTAFADSEEKIETRRKGIRFILENGSFEFLKTSIPNLYSPGTRENQAGLVKEHLDSVHNFLPEALVKYYESMIARPDRRSVLKDASIPILFIMGKYDTAVPVKDGLELCKLPRVSYIHILNESGHMGMLEEPEKANDHLKEYLAALKPQT